MNANDVFVQQQARKAQSDCQLAERNITQSTTLMDVARYVRVTVPPYLRSVLRRDTYRVQQAGERRAEELLAKQLEELEKLSGDALAKRLGWFKAYEWRHLAGNFPRLAQNANREGSRLAARARAEQAAAPANMELGQAHG